MPFFQGGLRIANETQFNTNKYNQIKYIFQLEKKFSNTENDHYAINIVLLFRSNSQIKLCMVDVNAIKKPAMTINQLDGNIDCAVKTFWPANSTATKQVPLTLYNNSGN